MHARACTRRQEGPTFGNQFFLSLLSSDHQADASTPESSFCLFAFGFSPYRASLYSPDCPETHHIDQPGLQLRDPPACVLGLREGPLTPSSTESSCFDLSPNGVQWSVLASWPVSAFSLPSQGRQSFSSVHSWLTVHSEQFLKAG